MTSGVIDVGIRLADYWLATGGMWPAADDVQGPDKMDALVESSWRLYPAMALGLVGFWLVVSGVRWQIEGLCRSARDSRSLLRALRGFRLMVIGLGLAGIAAAWQWAIVWLFVLSLALAGEETFESSVMIGALKHERPRRR